jgi:hypothetical protein
MRQPVTWIWLLLVGATALSWSLGADHGVSTPGYHRLAAVIVLLVAFFKVRMVAIHFMEVGRAPWVLRLIIELWVLLVCTALIMLYLFTPKG